MPAPSPTPRPRCRVPRSSSPASHRRRSSAALVEAGAGPDPATDIPPGNTADHRRREWKPRSQVDRTGELSLRRRPGTRTGLLLRSTGTDAAQPRSFRRPYQHGQRVIRLTVMPDFKVGWNMCDIRGAVQALRDKGVTSTVRDGMVQDGNGIWPVPDGMAKIAWFDDPDGNVLSVSEARRPGIQLAEPDHAVCLGFAGSAPEAAASAAARSKPIAGTECHGRLADRASRAAEFTAAPPMRRHRRRPENGAGRTRRVRPARRPRPRLAAVSWPAGGKMLRISDERSPHRRPG